MLLDALLWPFVLMMLAVVLIFLEIFIPSGGILSVLAAVSVGASLLVAFRNSMAAGAVMLLVAAVAVPTAIGVAVKWWPHTPIGKLVLIKRPESEDEVLPDTEEYHLREVMVGKRGVAKTVLLPSGDVVIDGRVYDAVSNGLAVEAGQAVQVVDVNTQRLVVRPLSDKERAEMAETTPDDVLSTPIDTLGIEPFDDPLA